MGSTNTETQTDKRLRKNIALIVALILLAVVGWGLYKIPCPSTAQFFYARISLALAASLATVALLSGFVRIKGRGLTAGGSIAIFVLVFYLAPTISSNSDRCSENFNFKILLRDTTGRPQVVDGSYLSMTIEGRVDRIKIQENATALFELIPTSYRDSVILVLLEMDGWMFNDKKLIVPVQLKGTNTTLVIEPDDSRCCVSGSVRDSSVSSPRSWPLGVRENSLT